MAVLAVLGLGALLFAPHLGQGFFTDDWSLLRQARDHSLWELVTAPREALAPGDATRVYWRPGWLALFDLCFGWFGAEPRPYVLLAVAMHLGNALLVYWLAFRLGGSRLAAFAGAALVTAFAPAAEGVMWIAAAFNVLPAAATALVAGGLLIIAAERRVRGPRRWAIGLAAISLCFREFAYVLAPLAFAAELLLRADLPAGRRLRTALAAALPFAALTAAHFWLLHGRGGPGTESGTLLAAGARAVAEHLRHLTGIAGSDAVMLAGAGALWLAAFASTAGAARALVVWVPLALFPHALVVWAERLGYQFLLVLATALAVLVAAPWRRRRWLAVAWLLVLAALGASNLARHAAAMGGQTALAAGCRRGLDWSRGALGGVERLVVDFVPPELANGWSAMLDVAAGMRIEVASPVVMPRPPFAVSFAPVPDDGPGVRFARFDHAARTFAIVPRGQFFGGLVPVPMFAFAEAYEVVPAAQMAERTARADFAPVARALVAQDPQLRPGPGTDAITSFVPFPRPSLEVTVGRLGLLLVHSPVPVDPTRFRVLVDGVPVPAIAANGPFHAVVVPPGRHRIVIEL